MGDNLSREHPWTGEGQKPAALFRRGPEDIGLERRWIMEWRRKLPLHAAKKNTMGRLRPAAKTRRADARKLPRTRTQF